MIYYRAPDIGGKTKRTIDDIPLDMPLMIACRGSKPNEVIHSRVKRYARKDDDGDDEFIWCAVKLDGQGMPLARKEHYRLGLVDCLPLFQSENFILASRMCGPCSRTTRPSLPIVMSIDADGIVCRAFVLFTALLYPQPPLLLLLYRCLFLYANPQIVVCCRL